MGRSSLERNAALRVATLGERLLRLQHEYYVQNAPTATDTLYDGLFDELVRIETEFPSLKTDDSPTQRIGSDLSQDLKEVAHRIPVLSLDKAYNREELLRWTEKVSTTSEQPLAFTAEEKIDGSSIVLYYERGGLRRAVTRGNGHVGNDVTANVRTIRSVPLQVPVTTTLAVRGEIYLALGDFARINASAAVHYANPRNLASGAVRRSKSSDVAAIPLRLFVYDVTNLDQTEPSISHAESIDRLRAWGFPVNPQSALFVPSDLLAEHARLHSAWPVLTLAALPGWLENAERERSTLDYEIDGMVIKVDDLGARQRLGSTDHHPRWALALKFDSPEGETVVLDVQVQIGRTGRVTPVARVEPVAIAGSTIANVNLHNQDYVDALELAVGDRVAVSKRGDVIPAVERVVDKNQTGNTTWRLPSECPTCRRKLRPVGGHHFCPNQRCPDQVRGRIRFFAARGQMDIDNLGSETIDMLIERKLVADVDQIYTFDLHALLAIRGFGDKKVELIRRGIEASRSRPFASVLAALGMPEIGPKVVELLVEAGYRDIDRWFDVANRAVDQAATTTESAGDNGALAELVEIDGIGEKTARAIVAELNDGDNRERIAGLRRAGLRFATEEPQAVASVPQLFGGQTWCVTGSFDAFESRARATATIKQHGGRVASSVTSRTTHLLSGRGGGSKGDKATELGVIIVDEQAFASLLRESNDIAANAD